MFISEWGGSPRFVTGPGSISPFSGPGYHRYVLLLFLKRGVKLLESVDISTRGPWITQNEQHFVAGQIPHELDAQMEGHQKKKKTLL
jgi:hypothetical protein